MGLVIETRPDEINLAKELAWLRRLGVTKVQMGAQSLDERILELNQRGHTAADTLKACAMPARRRVQDRAALDAQPAGRHARLGPGRFRPHVGRG